MNLVVRSSNWLGDAVIAVPAVRALRRGLPAGARLTLLAPPKIAALWHCIDGVDAVLEVDDNPAITADRLRAQRFDAAILFPNSLRTALEVWLARIPRRVGFPGHRRSWLLTDSVPRPSRAAGIRHQMEDYLDLASHVPGGLPESALRRDALLAPQPCRLPRPAPGRWLAVCPGAEYGPAKRWPAPRFAAAAQATAQARGWDIVLLGAEGDRPACAEVARHLTVPSLNLAGATTLREFLAWLGHAEAVLCNDSGAMHVAALFGRPGAAIFGSTEPRLTGPITPSVRVLREHVPCSPCFLRECPIDFRCMTGVTVDHALDALLTI
jgi:heptosyltransferase-2